MDPTTRKQLIKDYKDKPAVGAVYCIECSGNRKRIVKSTPDLGGLRSRFDFAQKIQSCPDPALQGEWAQYGNPSFTLTVLDELPMKENQTTKEFRDDLKVLLELWLEKLASGDAQ